MSAMPAAAAAPAAAPKSEPKAKKPKPKNKTVATLAGAVAGGIEATATWPAESVKTKLQLQDQRGPNVKYRGAFHCAVSTVRETGFLSLYRGLTPVLLCSLPKAGVRFGGFALFASSLRDEQGKMSPGANFVAGLGAGAAEAALVVTPQETLKVRLINANKPFVSGTLHILRTEGVGGMYKGLMPTVVKQASNQGVRFLCYNEIMRMVRWGEPADSPVRPHHALVSGMAAGCISVLANNPVDVVKTRMQGNNAHLYSSSIDCTRRLLVNEGPLALYRGALSRMYRVVPGQGIIFMSYEKIVQLLDPVLSR